MEIILLANINYNFKRKYSISILYREYIEWKKDCECEDTLYHADYNL